MYAIAGAWGVAYAAIFALLCVPGLPLGFALFGRDHAAGWIAGLLLGYATTAFVWWLVVFSGHPATRWFIGSVALAGVAVWIPLRSVSPPYVLLPRWTLRDTAAIALVLLMVPVLVVGPFARLGSVDAAGNRQYRAYFIADFFWHTAVAAELEKQEPLPRNPFLASEPLHYYWTYFRAPATIAAQTGLPIQDALKLNAVGGSLLFVGAIFLAAWCALPEWPLAVAAAVVLTFIGPSAEGLAAIADLVRRGQPLSGLRDLNIDAVAAWAFKGLRIDDLPRALWYTPHHAFSCALGLLAFPVAIGGGLEAATGAIVLAGCALGASVAFNPLVGAVFCGVYGLCVSLECLAGGRPRDWVRHLLAAVPVACAFAWCTFSQVGQGAGIALLHLGFWGPARNRTLLNLVLQLGPILVAMGVGLWPTPAVPAARVRPALVGVILAVLLMHLVTLTSDLAWIGFRGGHVFLVTAPAIVARGLASLWYGGRRRAAAALAAFVMVAGAPTTVIDAYNAQDVSNQGFAPRNEFHWTVRISPDEQAALEWIRTQTPRDAVVQTEPAVRGRETWSLIPTFAERRMATGLALALLPLPEYEERNRRALSIFASHDPELAWREARHLGIDYVYVGGAEREAYPSVAKFDDDASRFVAVFRQGKAAVYAVQP